MPNPLLVLRIGWMEGKRAYQGYQGEGAIQRGGKFVEEHGVGMEMWNFREEGGRFYGYAKIKNLAGVNLYRVVPDREWKIDDELHNVDIVFISSSGQGSGQVVVGWYKNATVFHKKYRDRRGSQRRGDWDKIMYLCKVPAKDGTLLDAPDRTFVVPMASEKNPGFIGRSHVWYADSERKKVVDFKKKLRKYISGDVQVQRSNHAGGKRGGKPDEQTIIDVEQAAIKRATQFYKRRGYKVESVEADYVGWDLEATKGREKLLIEVKGHKGNVIQFELTPNEYEQLQERRENYVVCVVRNALTKPEPRSFRPKKRGDKWFLHEVDGNEEIRLDEKVAARAMQTKF